MPDSNIMDYIKSIVVICGVILVYYRYLSCKNLPNTTLSYPKEQTSLAERDIFFLHIHKTGGTTVNNLLRNRAVSHQLSMALFNGNPWPDTEFIKYIVNYQSNTSFQVVYNHIMYNQSELDMCMSRDRLHVTLLRHPLGQLKSLFNFLNLKTYFNISAPDPVVVFLNSPDHFERLRHTHYRPISLTKNMAASFFIGEYLKICLDPEIIDKPREKHNYTDSNSSATNCVNVCQHYQDCSQLQAELNVQTMANITNTHYSLVEFIHQRFDLVLIHEYFDESLVLLKRLANWVYKDILYLQARKKIYPFKYSHYSMVQRATHQQWSPVDYEIYEHFKSKIEETMASAGDDFKREVKQFRKIRRQFQSFCHNILHTLRLYRHFKLNTTGVLKVLKRRFVMESQLDSLLDISGEDCVILAVDPNVFQSCLKCQLSRSLKETDFHVQCSGRGEVCWNKVNIHLIKGVLPLEMFKPSSALHWGGWPLMWD